MQLRALDLLAVSTFSVLTATGALVFLPLYPVPITLQTLFAYLSGAVLGPWLGAASQIIYILLGAIGLPVFAGGRAGLATLLGPTGGYLFGFVAASFAIGKACNLHAQPSARRIAASFVLDRNHLQLRGCTTRAVDQRRPTACSGSWRFAFRCR